MFKWTKRKIHDMIEEHFERFAKNCGKKSIHDFTWDFHFDIKCLPKQIEDLQNNKVSHEAIASCSKCKCLVYKKEAIKEPSTVEMKKLYNPHGNFYHDEEVVVENYSCHRCVGTSK